MPTPARTVARLTALLTVAALLAGVFAVAAAGVDAAPADASPTKRYFETRLLELHNNERKSRGMQPLIEHTTITVDSRKWSQGMASRNKLEHQTATNGYTSYATTSCQAADPNWKRCAENVGVGYDIDGLHQAFMNSAGHRANILRAEYNRVGIGSWVDGTGRLWVTIRFLHGTSAATPPPPTHPQDLAAGTALSAAHGDVLRLYRAFFNREPDRDGARYWISIYDQGHSISTIAGSFAMSKEYSAHYAGTTNRQFMDKVYRNVLGRAPDTEGINYWTQIIDSKRLSRSGVVVWIAVNAEFKSKHPYTTMP